MDLTASVPRRGVSSLACGLVNANAHRSFRQSLKAFRPPQRLTLRLKVGEDYQGWKLLMIRGREATMGKDQQAALLTLPQPGGGQSSGEVRLLPVSVVTRR
jgi:hypothetical protein